MESGTVWKCLVISTEVPTLILDKETYDFLSK